MYYNPIYAMNEWIIEKCLCCGSINHIFIDSPDIYAWECYFCSTKFWLDELALDSYIIENNVSDEQAYEDLQSGSLSIKYAYGHYEKEGR